MTTTPTNTERTVKNMKIRIIDFNKCNLPNCDCGWNITIGGVNKESLRKLKAFIVDNFEIEDLVKYEEKIGTKKFIKKECKHDWRYEKTSTKFVVCDKCGDMKSSIPTPKQSDRCIYCGETRNHPIHRFSGNGFETGHGFVSNFITNPR